MIDASQHHPVSTLAITLMIGTGILLAGMDATAKYLASGVPIIMVLWGRYFFHTLLTFSAYSIKTRSFKFMRARSPGLQFYRALSLFGATFFLYQALIHMPLGDASAIQFLAPVLVTALSGIFLGEKVGPRRWVGVVCGFVGVLLVARPGSGIFGWHALLPFATAILLAIYMMLTRTIRTRDDPAATTFYSTAVGAVILSILVIFDWQTLSHFEWLLMVIMGAAGAIGHFMLVKSFTLAEASMLAPFTYAQVVAAIIWGYLVFEDVPSFWTLGGAGIVVASGTYIWYREIQIHKTGKPKQ